jgi:hypothetical protein
LHDLQLCDIVVYLRNILFYILLISNKSLLGFTKVLEEKIYEAELVGSGANGKNNTIQYLFVITLQYL